MREMDDKITSEVTLEMTADGVCTVIGKIHPEQHEAVIDMLRDFVKSLERNDPSDFEVHPWMLAH